MTLQALSRYEAMRRVSPFPWYMDQNNASGVCVKDATGETVFYENFGSIPDEMPSHQADGIRMRAVTLAQFLVEWTKILPDFDV